MSASFYRATAEILLDLLALAALFRLFVPSRD